MSDSLRLVWKPELIWHRTTDGTYVAIAAESEGGTITRSWHIHRRASGVQRWSIESVIIIRPNVPRPLSLPPVSVQSIAHGGAYTLREGKETCGGFQARNIADAADPSLVG